MGKTGGMQSRGGSWKIFFIVAAPICGFMALAFGGLFGGASIFADDGCPYGYGNTRPGSASTTCKQRPRPTANQARSVADGTAIKTALKTFRARKEASKGVLAVGVNAWGETTFTLGREKYLTIDRTGALPKQGNASGRTYAIATITEGSFKVDRVRAEGLSAALRRVTRGRPDAQFRTAVLGPAFGGGIAWNLSFYVVNGSETTGGFVVQMAPDRKNLCVLGKEQRVRGVAECNFSASDDGFTTAPSTGGGSKNPASPPGSTSNAIKESVDKQIECAKKAGADAAKIQACVGG